MNRLFDLTPLQTRRTLDVVTGLVVASVGIALAGLTWRIAGHAGQGAITVPSGARPAMAVPDTAAAIALAPFGKAAIADQAQPTALAVVLKGVVFAVPATLSTAFVSENGATPRPYRIGEALAGATIEGIQRDRVLLNNGGRIEFLAFPDPTLAANSGSTAPGAGPAAPGATPVATATPIAASAPPPTAPAALLGRLDASPTEGGYAIGANAPPGLQQGDVIQSVNGQQLGQGAADQAAFAAAQRSGSAQVQLLRDGKAVTLTVPLR
ncbi:type II secretion system protein N [Sphingomonas baiyangensis]|uniref:Signaling protein n=1 Tax=Sphingomonas baiyangensis TaxID=2572576 RepID=A0A4U1L845_9SPHN|nr:type II secretion system protein N [Sphingomonas baiyangensis]TKD53119.1 signaling protein [Sphingomonas baiyangensis]